MRHRACRARAAQKTGLVRRRGRPEGSRKVTIARTTEARQTRPHRWHDARLAETGRQKPSTLFIVADAATLVADARHKGLLWNVLGRPGPSGSYSPLWRRFLPAS